MGNKRFKILSHLNINYYEVDVPVEIDKGVILLDTLTNQVLLQLKLRNISTKVIQFIEIDVECFDLTGDKVNEDYIVNYVYQDFEVAPKNLFGDRQAIRLAGLNTRQVNINFKRIMFSDGIVLSFDKIERFDIPQTTSVESLELDLRSEIDSTIKNLPKMINDHEWICCCGRVNIGETFCVRCGREKDRQLEELNLSHLKQLALERQAREEQVKKEQKEKIQFRREKIKHTLKNPLVITLLVIVLGINVFIMVFRNNDSRLELISKGEKQELSSAEVNRIQYRVTDNESYLRDSTISPTSNVAIYAESIVECNGQCESKYMDYDEALDLVTREESEGFKVYEEWWKENRTKINKK